MLFSYGSNSNEPNQSGQTPNTPLSEGILPNTKPWVMCMNTRNQVYYVNLFTKQTSYTKPLCFVEYENNLKKTHTPELNRELDILRRKVHIYEGKKYEESYQNTTDICFTINPIYTHKKGDTVWYIPNFTDPLIKSTVVDVHHDKPPFYTIRYTNVGRSSDDIVEKNTTAPRIKKHP